MSYSQNYIIYICFVATLKLEQITRNSPLKVTHPLLYYLLTRRQTVWFAPPITNSTQSRGTNPDWKRKTPTKDD